MRLADQGTVAEKRDDSNPRRHTSPSSFARQRLFRRILSLRNSIETEKGLLPESYPLIREDRDR